MNEQAASGILMAPGNPWALLFAKDADPDLDFDEGLEDDELYRRKPPRRRPILWILIFLLAVGVVYWAMDPDTSLLPQPESKSDPLAPPRIEVPHTGKSSVKTIPDITIPTPQFQEGQIVQLVQQPGQNTLLARLLKDPSGVQPGPMVKIGETLKVLDGEIVGEGWVYKVQTQSGATGWVLEKSIKSKASKT